MGVKESTEVEVKYKCQCMTEEAVLSVPARRPGEDIVFWMNSCVQTSLYLDHRRRSPKCRRDTMEYADIHINHDPDTYVGQGPRLS